MRAAPDRVAGPLDALTDVAGLRVGQIQRRGRGWLTGTTVVLTPPGSVGAVDVRGGGPGTRETDLLDPANLVQHVHAICLSGGSAFGLAAADGVVSWLAERGIGFPVGPGTHEVVPIVPAAVLFDLGRGGRFANRPGAAFGEMAARRARRGPVAQGTVGAGTGAVAGGLKGGVGTASLIVGGRHTVAALVAVNASGRVFYPGTGLLLGDAARLPGERRRLRRPARAELAAALALLAPVPTLSTTIGVVATDAELAKAECRRLAMAAHDGLARAVNPAHGPSDGDTFFALATGSQALEAEAGAREFNDPTSRASQLRELGAAAADSVTRAIVKAVLAATTAGGFPSYLDAFPSALRAVSPPDTAPPVSPFMRVTPRKCVRCETPEREGWDSGAAGAPGQEVSRAGPPVGSIGRAGERRRAWT